MVGHDHARPVYHPCGLRVRVHGPEEKRKAHQPKKSQDNGRQSCTELLHELNRKIEVLRPQLKKGAQKSLGAAGG